MKYNLKDGSSIEINWDVPGWDWAENDFFWLSSETHGIDSGFFIHGGKIRHQRHIPEGDYTVAAFVALLKQLSGGLESPLVMWTTDTGGGDPGLWVEGTRPPTQEDAEALGESRKRRDAADKRDFDTILARHPDWMQPSRQTAARQKHPPQP